MGKDKYENEELIKYGLPEDIWFHVEDMSSAHVYLRLKKNERLEDISDEIIHQCAQMVKANSIEGCKKAEVTVIHTRWRNLLKTADMEAGAIGFRDNSKVKRLKVMKDKSIVNRLNKTKEERYPNLEELQQARAREYQQEQKEARRRELKAEQIMQQQRAEEARLRSYADVMVADNMRSNKDVVSSEDDSAARDYEEDFM